MGGAVRQADEFASKLTPSTPAIFREKSSKAFDMRNFNVRFVWAEIKFFALFVF